MGINNSLDVYILTIEGRDAEENGTDDMMLHIICSIVSVCLNLSKTFPKNLSRSSC
jgi:hypothetical protein